MHYNILNAFEHGGHKKSVIRSHFKDPLKVYFGLNGSLNQHFDIEVQYVALILSSDYCKVLSVVKLANLHCS